MVVLILWWEPMITEKWDENGRGGDEIGVLGVKIERNLR